MEDSNKMFVIHDPEADILSKVIRLMNKHPAVTMVKIFQVPQFKRHVQLYMDSWFVYMFLSPFGSEAELHFCWHKQ